MLSPRCSVRWDIYWQASGLGLQCCTAGVARRIFGEAISQGLRAGKGKQGQRENNCIIWVLGLTAREDIAPPNYKQSC